MNFGIQTSKVANTCVMLVLNFIQKAKMMIPLVGIHSVHCISNASLKGHVKSR